MNPIDKKPSGRLSYQRPEIRQLRMIDVSHVRSGVHKPGPPGTTEPGTGSSTSSRRNRGLPTDSDRSAD